MKIIHITGHSNSGKTTFIHKLLDRMCREYPNKIGVIKHMGHHCFELAPGKDTTTHFEHNAYAVAGIDSSKTVVAIHSDEFKEILDSFCDAGLKFTIIEGFKDIGFSKIVMGELDAENCILRNPSVDDVINSLDRFDDYYTMQGVVIELKSEVNLDNAGAVLSFNGIVRKCTGSETTEYLEFDNGEYIDKLIAEIEEKARKVPGIIGVKFYHTKGRIYAGGDLTYFAIVAAHRQEAFSAMAGAIDELKAKLHDVGKELSA